MANCLFLLNDGSHILLNDGISALLMNDDTCVDGGAEPERITGATYLTPAELRRYKAYWQEINRIEKQRFKRSQDRDRALTETIERAYRKAQGEPEPLLPEASKAEVRAVVTNQSGQTPPTLAKKTLTYLDVMRPRADGVLKSALSELYYLQLKVDAERAAAFEAKRLARELEDEDELFLMLLS